MDRLACVDVPELPLQLLLQKKPEWADHPVAVVAEDKPQGLILWVNEAARRHRILPGQRYATALALSRELRAAYVPPGDTESGVKILLERLRRFSPNIEPSVDEPGVFWLDASGLEKLFGSLADWARGIRLALSVAGFISTVAVGFTRFGSYAITRSLSASVHNLRSSERSPRGKTEIGEKTPVDDAESEGMVCFDAPAKEAEVARRVPLDRLRLDSRVREALLSLGVRSVGDFLQLPAAGLQTRFGPEVYAFYRLAHGELWMPLQSEVPEQPVRRRLELESPESQAMRLLIVVERQLHPMLIELSARHQALAGLRVELLLDRPVAATDVGVDRDAMAGRLVRAEIRPAVPTLDAVQLIDLARLQLETLSLGSGVIEIRLTAQGEAATRDQLQLFCDKPRRDLAAVDRAMARLRTEFGDDAVVRACPREGHLPEARFAWVPLARLPVACPRPDGYRVLVRRFFTRPQPLAGQPRHTRNDGWFLRGHEGGAVVCLQGPYKVTGGWWQGEVRRDYHFAEIRRGDLLWIYYDNNRRRWFLQGQVV